MGDVEKVDAVQQTVTLKWGETVPYNELVLATGCRIVPEAIEHFDTEAHHFYTRRRGAGAAPRAWTPSLAAASSSASPACPTSAPRRPWRWRCSSSPNCATAACATRSELHFCSPIGRAFTIESVSDMVTPILAEKGIELHTFSNVERIDRRPQGRGDPRGRGVAYDLLILVPPHKGQQFLIASGLAPARPAVGCRPTGRPSQVAGQPDIYALGDATDLPLSKAGSTAHFEAPVVAERIAAAVEGRQPSGKHADYEGKVMCFFEVGDGKGTLLQFDYAHPPRPPRPNRFWHLGQDRLQQDVLAHRAQRPRLARPGWQTPRPNPRRRSPGWRNPGWRNPGGRTPRRRNPGGVVG